MQELEITPPTKLEAAEILIIKTLSDILNEKFTLEDLVKKDKLVTERKSLKQVIEDLEEAVAIPWSTSSGNAAQAGVARMAASSLLVGASAR